MWIGRHTELLFLGGRGRVALAHAIRDGVAGAASVIGHTTDAHAGGALACIENMIIYYYFTISD